MTPLPFRLPDSTRIAWSSEAARQHWDPKFQAIRDLWVKLERWTVAAGVRRACLQAVEPSSLPTLGKTLHDDHLMLIPLGRVARSTLYAGSARPPKPGEAYAERVAIVKHDAARAFQQAWSIQDDSAIGELLGYPICCRSHFAATWKRGNVDPTFEQAKASASAEQWPIECNSLARWIGLRAVPHLPCAFTCPATVVLARAFGNVAEDRGQAEIWRELLDILRWPIRWSALHGIAIIETPIYRVVTRTNATANRLDVALQGTVAPAHADSIEHKAALPLPVDTWTENGFASGTAMNEAHDVVVNTLVAAATAELIRWPTAALDLGCGNGQLIRRLATTRIGIDSRAEAVEAARRHDPPGIYARGYIADVSCWAGFRADLTILMVDRLGEIEAERRRDVAEALDGRLVAIYRYSDHLVTIGQASATPIADAMTPMLAESGLRLEKVYSEYGRRGVCHCVVGRLRKA